MLGKLIAMAALLVAFTAASATPTAAAEVIRGTENAPNQVSAVKILRGGVPASEAATRIPMAQGEDLRAASRRLITSRTVVLRPPEPTELASKDAPLIDMPRATTRRTLVKTGGALWFIDEDKEEDLIALCWAHKTSYVGRYEFRCLKERFSDLQLFKDQDPRY